MLNVKRIVPIIGILLSGCIVVPTYTNHISFQPTRQSEQKVTFNNVLMIGAGPVASRVFLDNLSTEMMQTFKRKGVESDFSYVGKVPSSATLKLDSLVVAPFDACLVFRASEDSYLNMTNAKFTAIGPGVVATSNGNHYQDTYTVSLYTKKENMQLVWQGDLEVDFDLANDSRYKHISGLIFKELVKNQVLSN